MSKNDPRGVYFVDGYSPRKDAIGLVSYLHELSDKDIEHSRFYTIINGKWGCWEVDDEIRSVSYTEDPIWWLLGKRGVITKISPAGFEEEIISDAGIGKGSFGNLTRIKSIAGDLYACGFRRQVYKRNNGDWIHIDDGILVDKSERGPNFMDIDGTEADDLYAVGTKGEMFRYDGKKWHSITAITNVTLESVKCVNRDLVYACGKKGVILRGSGDSWEILGDESFNDIFWDVEMFNDEIYISRAMGILRLNGDSLEVVKTGLGEPIDGYRLHSADGTLWSIGQNCIANFDGKKWKIYKCPDNP